MTEIHLFPALVAFLAAFLAGAINSVAGGGTLVSFPALVWLGLPSVTANATSTVAIVPGSAGSMWGYRRELRTTSSRMLALIVPSLLGGISGALLLSRTSPGVFDKLVPFLIAFATILFMVQDKVQKALGIDDASSGPKHESARWLVGAMLFQFCVGVYGGYFGAGIGILMLAALSILGLSDIHQMNALKNSFAVCINGIAAAYFVWAGMVSWPYVAVMAVGAVIGGYGCAGVARRVGRTTVRHAVIAIGWVMAVSLFIKK
jgi:uncharacterized protein